jgi:hypothetical protein
MGRRIEDYLPPLKEDGINTDENIVTTGTVTAAGVTNSGNQAVTGTLAVTGATTLSSTLAVTGATTLSGAVNFKRQVTDTGGAYATPVALTEAQSGRIILVDDAAGLDFTLPAIAAAQIGTHYKFLVTVSVTSNNFRVTAQAGDLLKGGLWMVDFNAAYDSATRDALWAVPDGSDDLIMTMNGTTTGGKAGTWVEFTAISATEWFVNGVVGADGVIATPFS